ncbi:MAG: hypothetical protein ACOYD9_06390 [Pyramidobacter sp.]|jgi:hypothetical protein
MKRRWTSCGAARGVLLLILTLTVFRALPAAAVSARFYGLTVELPDGWSVKQGEQVVIYNENEKSAAVIVDQLDEGSARAVAEDLAEAVGVDKKDIRSDGKGALELNFVQNGEPVGARVLQKNESVLMIYSIGESTQANQIARSLGAKRK